MAVRKVLHVIPSVGPLRGGPSAMVRQLALNLSSAGIETHVATTNDNGPGTLAVPCGVPVQDAGVAYWYFPRQTRFYTFSWPLNLWLSRHVADFDLVHIHALFSFATLPAAFWAHRRGVPYIVRPLGTLNEWGMANRRPWLKKLSFTLLERRVMRNAAMAHYTSLQERFEAEQLDVTTPAAVIPNALPEPGRSASREVLRSLYPQLNGRQVVLFLSRLDEKKGLDLLLDAFAEVRRQVANVSLVIAGRGESALAGSLQARAALLGIQSDIVWTGFLEGTDKQAALAGADIFVLPSYSENFGIAVAEAMGAGIPVVVSDQVAIHDDVASAGAGLVVPCDAGRLADAMVTLLSDAALRASMGANGRSLAQSAYSPDAVTGRIIGLYNAVLQ